MGKILFAQGRCIVWHNRKFSNIERARAQEGVSQRLFHVLKMQKGIFITIAIMGIIVLDVYLPALFNLLSPPPLNPPPFKPSSRPFFLSMVYLHMYLYTRLMHYVYIHTYIYAYTTRDTR